jgi:hypothetical protein
MAPARDGSPCAVKLHDSKWYADPSQRDFGAIIDTASEKECKRIKTESLRSGGFISNRTQTLLLALTATLVALIWAFNNDCLLTRHWKGHGDASVTVGLAGNPALSTASSAVVLEVFQVYQPVLTQPAAASKTDLHDGSEDKEASAAASAKSCEVLLMEHSFGFSYGKPFVGTEFLFLSAPLG